MHINRRGFFLLGAAAAGVLIAGCQGTPPEPLAPAEGTAKTVLFAEGMH